MLRLCVNTDDRASFVALAIASDDAIRGCETSIVTGSGTVEFKDRVSGCDQLRRTGPNRNHSASLLHEVYNSALNNNNYYYLITMGSTNERE